MGIGDQRYQNPADLYCIEPRSCCGFICGVLASLSKAACSVSAFHPRVRPASSQRPDTPYHGDQLVQERGLSVLWLFGGMELRNSTGSHLRAWSTQTATMQPYCAACPAGMSMRPAMPLRPVVVAPTAVVRASVDQQDSDMKAAEARWDAQVRYPTAEQRLQAAYCYSTCITYGYAHSTSRVSIATFMFLPHTHVPLVPFRGVPVLFWGAPHDMQRSQSTSGTVCGLQDASSPLRPST